MNTLRKFFVGLVVGAVVALSVTALAQVTKRYQGTHVFDLVQAKHIRVDNNSALSAADVNLTKAQIQAATFFPVNTGTNAVDVDFADDAALDSADVGSIKDFVVTTGHATQALTVTAGASGVTTVTTINTIGTTCEDEGDWIRCIVRTTAKATCMTVCAD